MMYAFPRALLLGMFLLLSESGIAATAPVDETQTAGQIQEIVVTAERRSENVQDVPSAISVFSAADLKSSGIFSSDELAMRTPGLVFDTINGFAQPFIRGIGSDQVTASAEAAVGYYVDGVYFASVSAMQQQLNDIERIEILKGPQGTLYGRNTTGGAINIVTRDPDPNGAAGFSVYGGNLSARQFKTYVSGGTPTLAASLAAISTYHAGYMTNLVDGTDENDENSWGARAKIKYTPNDMFSTTVAIDYSSRNDHGGASYNPLEAHPIAALVGGLYSTNPETTYNDFPGARYRLIDKGVSVNARVHLSGLDLVSISAYRDTYRYSGVDLDASSVSIENVSAPQPAWNWSQEFQAVSTRTGPWKWIGGLYAFGSRVSYDPLNVYLPTSPPPNYLQIFGTQDTTAYAVYGQATYAFTDAWAVTAGLRSNRDKKSLRDTPTVIPAFGLTTPGETGSKTWTNTSPMATLEYHGDGLLLYGKFSKGFKSGTYNILASSAPPVNPETITAYEVGGKHTLAHRSVLFDWSGFYYDYKNLQVSTVQNGQPNLQNAASSTTYGVDADLAFALGSGFKASLAGEWLHSTYKSFPNAVVYVPDPSTGGFGNISVQRDVSGNDTIRAPKLTVSTQLEYKVPVYFGSVTLVGTYYFNDGFAFDPGNLYRQRAYTLVNAQINVAMMNDHLLISAIGKNLGNKEILSGVAPSNLAILGQYDAPRTEGVEVSYRF